MFVILTSSAAALAAAAPPRISIPLTPFQPGQRLMKRFESTVMFLTGRGSETQDWLDSGWTTSPCLKSMNALLRMTQSCEHWAGTMP